MIQDGKIEKALNYIRTMNLTNLLIIFLILLISLPAYFAFKFISDTQFRREFMSSAVILEKHVPCTVLEGHRYGSQTRHSVLIAYAVMENRLEKLIGIRSPDAMSDAQITEVCKQVLALADKARATMMDTKDKPPAFNIMRKE